MIEKYYKRIREARTLAELKKVYYDFAQDFCENEISIEQFNSLRMAFHTARILRIAD